MPVAAPLDAKRDTWGLALLLSGVVILPGMLLAAVETFIFNPRGASVGNIRSAPLQVMAFRVSLLGTPPWVAAALAWILKRGTRPILLPILGITVLALLFLGVAAAKLV